LGDGHFEWVGLDGGYGKEPAFLRELDDMNEVFVADPSLRFRRPGRAAGVRRRSGSHR
jgi:hypothetical protein